MELLAGDLVRERTRYAMRSYLGFRLGRDASANELQDWLTLPASYNPRTHEFASELQRRVPADSPDRDARLVRAVLDHFRSGGFEYTLSPPRLGRHSVDEFLFDTKRGYCEHYASAFVVMMRALGVPARVVTGYQGGELNPVDGFVTVRQSDAHAWSEVWLKGRGWSRVDPTAVVAPARVDPAAEAARTAELARNPVFGNADWLRRVALQLGGRAEQLAPVGAVLLAGAPARAGGDAGAGAALGERRHRAGGARRPARRRHGGGVDAFARRARSAGRHLPAAEGEAAARGRRSRRPLRAARPPRAQRARPAARRRAAGPATAGPLRKHAIFAQLRRRCGRRHPRAAERGPRLQPAQNPE